MPDQPAAPPPVTPNTKGSKATPAVLVVLALVAAGGLFMGWNTLSGWSFDDLGSAVPDLGSDSEDGPSYRAEDFFEETETGAEVTYTLKSDGSEKTGELIFDGVSDQENCTLAVENAKYADAFDDCARSVEARFHHADFASAACVWIVEFDEEDTAVMAEKAYESVASRHGEGTDWRFADCTGGDFSGADAFHNKMTRQGRFLVLSVGSIQNPAPDEAVESYVFGLAFQHTDWSNMIMLENP